MKRQSKTDWVKLKAVNDEDIDTSDIPEVTDDVSRRPSSGPARRNR